FDDEDVEADRRAQDPHLDDEHGDDAEPDQVHAQRLEHRHHHRQRQDQHGDILHEGAEHEIGEDDDDQRAGDAEIEAEQELHHDLGQLRQRHERDEDVSAHQDEEDHRAGAHGLQHDGLEHGQAQLAP